MARFLFTRTKILFIFSGMLKENPQKYSQWTLGWKIKIIKFIIFQMRQDCFMRPFTIFYLIRKIRLSCLKLKSVKRSIINSWTILRRLVDQNLCEQFFQHFLSEIANWKVRRDLVRLRKGEIELKGRLDYFMVKVFNHGSLSKPFSRSQTICED